MPTPKSRAPVHIDPEVHKRLKIVAAEQGTTVKHIVEVALLAYFTRWPKANTVGAVPGVNRPGRARLARPPTSARPPSGK